MLSKELSLISGEFFQPNLADDKRYLLHYFKPGIQRQFLFYYLIFGNYRNFADHTGWWCSLRWLKKLKNKFLNLEDAYKKAKSEISEENLKLLAQLEKGKFKIGDLYDREPDKRT
jgi:hypothetical protein